MYNEHNSLTAKSNINVMILFKRISFEEDKDSLIIQISEAQTVFFRVNIAMLKRVHKWSLKYGEKQGQPNNFSMVKFENN